MLRPPTLPKPNTSRLNSAHKSGGLVSLEATIQRALYRVETAPAGQRHVALRNAALTLGGLLARAGIDRDLAARALLAAVQRSGGPLSTWRTLYGPSIGAWKRVRHRH